jgi:ribose 5-phosphate isomerase B
VPKHFPDTSADRARKGCVVKVALGADHRGFPLKERLRSRLEKLGHAVVDVGSTGTGPVDYPDYAFPVAEMVSRGEVDRGILVCGSGIGMAIAANKVPGVRAALCRTVDDARMARQHNDSNVLTLSEKKIDDDDLEDLVSTWLDTPFEGGRHQRRLKKISDYEIR